VSGPTPEEIRDLLEPWARRLMAEAKGAAIAGAADVHPVLATVAEQLLGTLLDDKVINKSMALLDRMLREIVGDDYPAKVEAAMVVIVDNRGRDDGN
tara:strand:- start:807 stop:1097 length:291 start_codon:yes stop_codon:yes gene_type:complete